MKAPYFKEKRHHLQNGAGLLYSFTRQPNVDRRQTEVSADVERNCLELPDVARPNAPCSQPPDVSNYCGKNDDVCPPEHARHQSETHVTAAV